MASSTENALMSQYVFKGCVLALSNVNLFSICSQPHVLKVAVLHLVPAFVPMTLVTSAHSIV